MLNKLFLLTACIAMFGSVYSMQNTSSSGQIIANLYRVTSNNEIPVDGIRIKFESQFSDEVTNEDADKLWNPDENIAVLNQDFYLSVDKRYLYNSQSKINLFFNNYVSNNYRLDIILEVIDEAYLFDNLTNTYHNLSSGTNQIYFNINFNSVASEAPDRFKIVFENPNSLSTGNTTKKDFSLYPNPSKNKQVNIDTQQLMGEKIDLKIYDQLGRNVYSQIKQINSNSMALNLDNIVSTGNYIVQIKTSTQQLNKRLIIQ